jgi:glucose/arabinose dehydrogenase
MSGFINLESNEISVNEASGQVFVPIVRTGDLSQAVTIEYGTSADTASSADFNGVSGTITMAAGQARVLVPVTILDDNLSEVTENFTFSLINVDSGSLQAPRTTQVAILDDENPVTDPVNPPLESDFDVNAQDLFGGGTQPIAFEFSTTNDNHMYLAEKTGLISLYDYTTGERLNTLIDLSPEVNNIQDRGLLDIAIHPDVENNPYLYAFVVVDPPQTAGRTGNAGPDGGGNRYSHVLRFELDADSGFTTIVPNSKTVLLGGAGQSLSDISGNGAVDSTSNITQPDSEIDPVTGEYIEDYIKMDSRSHAGGSLEFGPDGALYISTGDGASFNTTDPRAVSVLDVDSLAGKILRVDPITGEGLSDNPFFTGDAGANASKVYQLGLRNPFSMSFDAEGQLIVTNTGWNRWESLFAGEPGANFGWPYFEGGDNGQLIQANGYSNLPTAQAFYDAVDAGQIDITPAFRAFAHNSNEPGFQVQAITGADDLINSDVYPDALQDYYIFTDVSQGEVFAVNRNDQRDVIYLYTDNNGFGPVHFKQGPDGFMYYADIRSGQIGRLEITDPNAPQEPGTLQANIFAIASGTSTLDQINFDDPNLTIISSETVRTVNENTLEGFTEDGPSENFAVQYTGVFEASTAGTHTFFLTSDDGARLFIDGQLVVDNDGLHAAVLETGTVNLSAGQHTIEVQYFEAGGRATLDLDWSGPGFSRTQMVFEDEPSTPGDTINGTPGDDILIGTDGDDVMLGNGGEDDFYTSLGNDTIVGNAGYDQVDYEGARDDYTFTRNGDGTITVVGALTGTDTLPDIDGFWFRGEARWYPVDEIFLVPGEDIIGTPGNDQLLGTDADDTMIGNGGSDFFNESTGNDTIIGNAGEYDQVNYFGAREDYTFTQNADGTVTVVNTTSGTDTLTDIDGFWFNGSQQWLPLSAALVPPPNGGPIEGTSGDDELFGTPNDDTMIGNGGSDFFAESDGNDTIIGDAGVYDQVNYFGFVEEYTFTQNADGTVTVVNNETGTDTLTEIDGFWFNDSQLWLPLEDVLPGANQVAGIGGSSESSKLIVPVSEQPRVLDANGDPISETDLDAGLTTDLAPIPTRSPFIEDLLISQTDDIGLGLIDEMAG